MRSTFSKQVDMSRRRLAVAARNLVRGLAVLAVTGTLVSASISPVAHWDWDRGDDMVPVDVAGAIDDPTPMASDDNLASTVDVTAHGAVGDGVRCNTATLQAVINRLGPAGGTIRFPAGRYVTGTLHLHDNVTLRLDRGAVLVGSLDPAQYGAVDECGIRNCMLHGTALIVANHARHVGITGRGVVDGRGSQLAASWPGHRPFLCRWMACDGVSVTGVTFTDPGTWVQHFFRCRHVGIDRVTVRCEDSPNANTDGIDVDSCQDVRITRCDVSSQDDAICLKTTSVMPCRNVAIEDCRVSSHCNGIKFGTESVGGFEHVRVRRCQMTNVGMAGIGIYSVDGADIRDVTVTDVQMRTVRTPIMIRLGSRLATFHPGERQRPTGSIQGVTIRGVRATGVSGTGVLISGVPGSLVRAVTLEDVRIGLVGGTTADDARMSVRELPHDYPQDDMFGPVLPASGLYLRHVHGLTLGSDVITSTGLPDVRPPRVRVDVAS